MVHVQTGIGFHITINKVYKLQVSIYTTHFQSILYSFSVTV